MEFALLLLGYLTMQMIKRHFAAKAAVRKYE